MDLEPTAEQRAIAESVRRWAREHVTPETLRAWEMAAGMPEERLWQQCAHLGWFGLGIPAHQGGADLGLLEVGMWFQEAARGLVPGSVMAAVRAGLALARIDPEAPELVAIARGQRLVAVATAEADTAAPSAWHTALTERSGSFYVTGEKWFVANASRAHLHLVGARLHDELVWCLVDAREARCVSLRSFDGEPLARVVYENAAVQRVVSRGENAVDRWQACEREQCALALVEMVGVMDAVLERTVAYVKEREQFGQKIGAFQAVQHQVADMATAYTASRHLAWQVVARLNTGTFQGWELATAAAFVPQACKRVTLTAHHLHGGAGYVVEHPLHYYAERAVTLCVRYGLERWALEAVAAHHLDHPPLPESR